MPFPTDQHYQNLHFLEGSVLLKCKESSSLIHLLHPLLSQFCKYFFIYIYIYTENSLHKYRPTIYIPIIIQQLGKIEDKYMNNIQFDLFSSFCTDWRVIYMLGSASIIRRQSFLIRCLRNYNKNHHHHCRIMQSVKMSSSGTNSNLEADALNILRSITPTLDPTRHKGQAGNLSNFTFLIFNFWVNFASEF